MNAGKFSLKSKIMHEKSKPDKKRDCLFSPKNCTPAGKKVNSARWHQRMSCLSKRMCKHLKMIKRGNTMATRGPPWIAP